MSSLEESANKIAKTFEKACCLRCFTVDVAKADGFSERRQDPYCSVCAEEQLKRKKQLTCENIHRYAVLQAEKWGGKYEYLCPAGLAFICASVQKGEETKYGIIAGPFLMVEFNDFIDEDLYRFFPEGDVKNLIAQAKALPDFNPGRVSHLADLLSMAAAYAAKRDSMQIRLMEQIAGSQSEVFHSLVELKEQGQTEYNYPIGQEKLLQGYIAQGDKAAASRILNEILGHIFFCSGGVLSVIKARVIELIVILSRAAIEGGADIAEVFGMNYDYLNDIQGFSTLNELNEWLAKVLIRFTNCVFDFSKARHSDLIKRVMNYIRSNYMKKISLNDLSGYLNISVSYLSKVFKEETEQSLSAFISQVRVENAKLFLLDDSIPLAEVAYLSGFEDQSYFSKVFKRMTGMTPGKFRASKGGL